MAPWKGQQLLPGRGLEGTDAMASLLLLARNPPVPRSLALVPSVSGFDPLKSQSSRGRRQDHQSSYAPGCSSLAVPLQPAVRGQSPTRVTSDPPTLHIMSACFGIACTVAGTPSTKDLGKGSGSLGRLRRCTWLTELAGDGVLGAAAAARETGGWARVLPATQMYHCLQGSQQDERTRTL